MSYASLPTDLMSAVESAEPNSRLDLLRVLAETLGVAAMGEVVWEEGRLVVDDENRFWTRREEIGRAVLARLTQEELAGACKSLERRREVAIHAASDTLGECMVLASPLASPQAFLHDPGLKEVQDGQHFWAVYWETPSREQVGTTPASPPARLTSELRQVWDYITKRAAFEHVVSQEGSDERGTKRLRLEIAKLQREVESLRQENDLLRKERDQAIQGRNSEVGSVVEREGIRSQNSDGEVRGEVIAVDGEHATCWVQIAPGVRVRTCVPRGAFGQLDCSPGMEFMWVDGNVRRFGSTAVAPEIRAEFETLNREFEEDLRHRPVRTEEDE